MDWVTGAKLAISALSGSKVKISKAQGFAGSGLGDYRVINNLDSGALIDLTKPSNFVIGALLAFAAGYMIKKGF